MELESEVFLAFPPWKEFMEKKRKKSRNEEQVPLWKRELLKRIQSKNQRMSEEKVDIADEHIPKVSDNIFLVHEKKHHRQRLQSAPSSKSFSSEASPTSPVILAVDNVIIIEKENKNAPGDMISDSAGSIDSVFTEEVKEYPKRGLVHRLLGKFQVEEKQSEKKRTKNLYQRSLSADLLLETDSFETKDKFEKKETAPEPIVVDKPKPDNTIQSETHPRTASMPSDMLTPLLMSSAKPFKSWQTSSNTDHGYHHVNMPIRKVSTPTSPKYTSPVKSVSHTETKVVSPVSKPMETEKFELIFPVTKEQKETHTNSFSDELSNLHSNREFSNTNKTASINKPASKPIEAPKVEKRSDFKNGETLHSSGSVNINNKPLPNDASATTTVKLQDKSNFTSYRPGANTFATKNDAFNKPDKKPIKPTYDRNKHVDLPITVENKIPDETKENDVVMKENRSYNVSLWKREKPDTVVTKEVIKISEPVLPAPQPRRTPYVKTVPKPRHLPQVEKPPTIVKNENLSKNKMEEAKTPTFQQPTNNYQANVSKSVKVSTKIPEKPIDLPRTDIDAVIITPVTSLPLSPTENKNMKIPEKESVKAINVPVATVKIEPVIQKETTKPKNNFVKQTSPKTTVVTPKSEPAQKSIFGSRVKTASRPTGGGFTFTIDPSKFKSSAARRTTEEANDNKTKDTGYGRTIVPSQRSEFDNTHQAPKTGKRKLTVDQITVIGGYVTLKKSCLTKNKQRKEISIKFSEYKLETTHTYESERSALAAENHAEINKAVPATPGFGKDSTIGKYTPKYLLSMKSEALDDEEFDTSESKSSSSDTNTNSSNNNSPNDAKPLTDDVASAWSDTTSGSTDILF